MARASGPLLHLVTVFSASLISVSILLDGHNPHVYARTRLFTITLLHHCIPAHRLLLPLAPMVVSGGDEVCTRRNESELLPCVAFEECLNIHICGHIAPSIALSIAVPTIVHFQFVKTETGQEG